MRSGGEPRWQPKPSGLPGVAAAPGRAGRVTDRASHLLPSAGHSQAGSSPAWRMRFSSSSMTPIPPSDASSRRSGSSPPDPARTPPSCVGVRRAVLGLGLRIEILGPFGQLGGAVAARRPTRTAPLSAALDRFEAANRRTPLLRRPASNPLPGAPPSRPPSSVHRHRPCSVSFGSGQVTTCAAAVGGEHGSEPVEGRGDRRAVVHHRRSSRRQTTGSGQAQGSDVDAHPRSRCSGGPGSVPDARSPPLWAAHAGCPRSAQGPRSRAWRR